MAPKAKPQQQQQQPSKGGQTKKSKQQVDSDDDDALLNAAAQRAAEAAVTLQAAKVAEDAKKAKAAAEEAARQKALVDTAKALPPIELSDAAVFIAEYMRPKLNSLRDACWLTYVFHRFVMEAVEKHRRIALRIDGELRSIVSFEVHDDKHPGDNHSWNVFTVVAAKAGGATETYVLDVSLEQFLPSGRYGYRHDGREELGWVPVKAVSRIINADAPEDASAPIHAGVLALDAGILSDGTIDPVVGVAKGSHDKYIKFLMAAADGRHKNMTADERSVAEILKRNRSVPLWIDMHTKLEEKFLSLSA